MTRDWQFRQKNARPDTSFAEQGFDLACRLAASPLILAYRAGSSHPLSLFFAALRDEAFLGKRANEILLGLLDFSIPNESKDGVFDAWADPMQVLATAWYPFKTAKERGENKKMRDYQRPVAVLTDLGSKIVTILLASPDCKPTQVLENLQRRWRDRLPRPDKLAERPRFALVLHRRLCVVDAILGETAPTDPAHR